MKRDIRLYVGDIIKSISLIEKYSRSLFFISFKKSQKNQDAIIRRLAIIGESMNQIPKEIRKKYPEIKWENFIEARNFLTHVYFGVNMKRVWMLIKKDLPVLKKQILKIKKDLA